MAEKGKYEVVNNTHYYILIYMIDFDWIKLDMWW
jgi:hypothetical protein